MAEAGDLIKIIFRKPGKQKRKTWVVDPAEGFYFWWLCIITVAILFNLVFIIARACFEDLQTRSRLLWLPFDYLCDIFYILDIIVRQRTGKQANFYSKKNVPQ